MQVQMLTNSYVYWVI